jgi:cob(I)alamin adenosyltransferase
VVDALTVPFPTTIKVGWKKFHVEQWEPLHASRAGMYGECDHLAGVIRVDTSHGPHQALETLLHECYHAAFDVGGISRLHDREHTYTEEAVVSYLASWHMTLLADNPHLVAYISWVMEQLQ